MLANPPTRTSVVPGMRYRHAPEAMDWLCNVLGFEKQAVFPDPDGSIMHAQLTLGSGMIMLGSLTGSDSGVLLKQPDEIGGAETRTVSLTVPDADAVYERVLSSGVEIPQPIEDKPYGGRGFTCRDPEGHLWDVGTYDPWQTAT